MVTKKDIQHYTAHGYVRLPGVIHSSAITLGRAVMKDWAERRIRRWQDEGLVSRRLGAGGFRTRLANAWAQIERKPRFNIATLRNEVIGPQMFRFISHPSLLGVAAALLGTHDISVNGVFLARARLPDDVATGVPWHRDGVYCPGSEKVHVVTIWVPLHDVTTRDGCLELASGLHLGRGRIADPTLKEAQKLRGEIVPARAQDAICFTHRTPHRSGPNLSKKVRWSIDVRYEATKTASTYAQTYGFVARCADGRPTPYLQWLGKLQSAATSAHP